MDLETKSLDTYNKKVVNDARVETILVPGIRDGLMMLEKSNKNHKIIILKAKHV